MKICTIHFQFKVDIATIDMEGAMVDVLGGAVTYDTGMVSYLAMENSFNVIATASIFSDFSMIVGGFMIVYAYASLMLGRFHMIENRVRCTGYVCLFVTFHITNSDTGQGA